MQILGAIEEVRVSRAHIWIYASVVIIGSGGSSHRDIFFVVESCISYIYLLLIIIKRVAYNISLPRCAHIR